MILKKIEELEGGEVLARNIMTWDYQIILPEGITIRQDYIDKLRELGITELYIKEETKSEEIVILKSEMEETIRKTVKDILERHTYQNNEELSELNNAADNIISTILEEDQVVEKIFDIKERSADIYEHSISICSLSILTALKLNVDSEKIHDIGVGCLLHDIGLRYTTIDYNNRDMDTLNKQEMAAYKKHPIYGYTSLKDEPWISDLSKSIILYHHERLDGSGFPLRAKDISFECKIVNVCDAFDEMICGIACERRKVYEAIEYLNNFKGRLFDSRIVDVFLGFTAVYPSGTYVLTNEGETAVVLSQNKDFKDRPVIRILKDKDGNEVKGNVIKDLVKVHNIFIEKTLD
ncbi:MAG: HD domain-containing protein [Muribaculaceae bacterium]|nr:HD domain-containing protein [Acetatifactor muris]MCM1494139.1 HD domain-containing protein [Muribaculaceae bacterium]MCM1559788.1 HD domain-containing protein [Butyrivibrio sp.]